MAIYVYSSVDGALASYCPDDKDPVADAKTLEGAGLVAVSGLAPLDGSNAWDQATRSVVAVPPLVKVRAVPSWQWILRFTPQEFAALRASADPATMQFMYALDRTVSVNLNDPVMVQAVNYVVSIGLLDASRVTAVMA